MKKILFEIAKKDLISAKILYKEKQYPQSLFLFQQCVEKLNKAIILSSQTLNINEIKKYSHNQIELYKKIIEIQERKIHSDLNLIEKYPSIISNLQTKEYYNKINEIKDIFSQISNSELQKIAGKDIDDIIREIRELEKIQIEIPEDYLTNVANRLGELSTEQDLTAKKEFQKLFSDNKSKTQIISKIKQTISYLLNLMKSYYAIYLVGLLTSPHSDKTRYPFENIKSNPIRIYTKRMPLIKKQGILMNLTENAIKRLDHIIV